MRGGAPQAPALASLGLSALLVAALACGDGSRQASEGHEPLSFLHSHDGDRSEPAHAVTAAPIPPGYDEIESVPVRLEEHDFRVATRAGTLVPALTQAPCTECHGPEGAKPLPPDESGAARPAHWQVDRAHGTAPLTCASCHAPEDPAALRVPTVAAAATAALDGTAAVEGDGAAAWPLEHSYRLCGTCHFGQLRDWAGGAHGKRLAGWSGPRVVAPCTACHDPHDPGLPQRLPATHSPPPEGNEHE